MALDPDLIDHWLLWLCLWDEFVRHASVPFVAVCITLYCLLCVRRAYRQRGIGEQTLKCSLMCYFGVLVNRHLSVIGSVAVLGCCYTQQAINLLLTGREGAIERIQEVLARKCYPEGVSRRCALDYNSPISHTSCNRFGAPLDLKFTKDVPVVSFDGIQGQEEPLTNLMIRQALRHEAENFKTSRSVSGSMSWMPGWRSQISK